MPKLNDSNIRALLSSEIEEKKYDIDLACQTLELVNNLKTKIQEDFGAIDSIHEKLSGITKIQFALDTLNLIKEDLKSAETKVDELVTKLTPKS